MGWYVEEVGDRECFQILAGKPSARRPLGRPWRWEGTIKLGLSEIGYEDKVDRTGIVLCSLVIFSISSTECPISAC